MLIQAIWVVYLVERNPMEHRVTIKGLFLGVGVLCAAVGCSTPRTAQQREQVARSWHAGNSPATSWTKRGHAPVRRKAGAALTAKAGATAPAAKPPAQVVRASDKNIGKVIEKAESYLGTQYAWGGMSRQGVDCSGLMVLAFREVGMELPRVSIDQYRYGKPVRRTDIQPGDLLFFSNYKPGVIGHTALCVALEDGIPRFVHASSSGVRHDVLTNAYWDKHYISACRVWGATGKPLSQAE
jgi:cell wall-associated NlpC family hydrolase